MEPKILSYKYFVAFTKILLNQVDSLHPGARALQWRQKYAVCGRCSGAKSARYITRCTGVAVAPKVRGVRALEWRQNVRCAGTAVAPKVRGPYSGAKMSGVRALQWRQKCTVCNFDTKSGGFCRERSVVAYVSVNPPFDTLRIFRVSYHCKTFEGQ